MILRGKSGIGLHLVEKVADYAGCSIDEILGRSYPAALDAASVLRRMAEQLEERDKVVSIEKKPLQRRSTSSIPPGFVAPEEKKTEK